eukprot:2491013-Rhodomonas_salina.2
MALAVGSRVKGFQLRVEGRGSQARRHPSCARTTLPLCSYGIILPYDPTVCYYGMILRSDPTILSYVMLLRYAPTDLGHAISEQVRRLPRPGSRIAYLSTGHRVAIA